MAKDNLMEGPDQEQAAGIINELEGKPAQPEAGAMTQKALKIPTSISPELAEANQGENIEFHISAMVTGKDADGVTLDVKKAFRMSPNAPETGTAPAPESLDVSKQT